ncbi:MAG: hypothetical protein KJO07_18305 [Deltaproteobacteria bacterium]|nr:hypothetical protein [Deltaproteobacteria bacterium]
MVRIHPKHDERVPISKSSELAKAPRLVVHFGTAPDGLPWLLAVDRSEELHTLFSTVCRIFGLSDRSELPETVHEALEDQVASGLVGVSMATIGGDQRQAYVSRNKLKRILGPTVLSQLLDEGKPPAGPDEPSNAQMTNVGAMAASHGDEDLLEAVERSIADRQSKRHLLVELDGGAVHSCSVAQDDKVLRAPLEPIRPLVLESLSSLPGTTAILDGGGAEWQVPLGEWKELSDALIRIEQNPYGGTLSYRIPRRALLGKLVELARELAKLHARERVHGDIAPGNVMLAEGGAVSFDSLDIAIGTPATAATFAWAAPEQIVGLPVDPATDVYSLTKMAAALVDGVPFGEETHYVVPIGGTRSRRVKLLKTEGVYLDILESGHERA